MSVLRERRLEACEKDLAGFPSHCLFDASCTDEDVEKLYAVSYLAEEEKQSSLHSVPELQTSVLASFPAELALLSREEHILFLSLILRGGRMPLQNVEDPDAARSLLRRLWCGLDGSGKNRFLFIPHQIAAIGLMIMAGDEHANLRAISEQVSDLVENTLYLTGVMPADSAVHHMQSVFEGTAAAGKPALYRRMLKAGFEYLFDTSGRLFLVHPGLAEPAAMLSSPVSFSSLRAPEADLSVLSEAYESLEEVEDPLYERMLLLIQDSVRPETTGEDTVEDLIILAKQSAPLNQMEDVLSTRLICVMTPEMRSSLAELHDRIPRWNTLNMSQVQ